jgi:hypothetical protein
MQAAPRWLRARIGFQPPTRHTTARIGCCRGQRGRRPPSQGQAGQPQRPPCRPLYLLVMVVMVVVMRRWGWRRRHINPLTVGWVSDALPFLSFTEGRKAGETKLVPPDPPARVYTARVRRNSDVATDMMEPVLWTSPGARRCKNLTTKPWPHDQLHAARR